MSRSIMKHKTYGYVFKAYIIPRHWSGTGCWYAFPRERDQLKLLSKAYAGCWYNDNEFLISPGLFCKEGYFLTLPSFTATDIVPRQVCLCEAQIARLFLVYEFAFQYVSSSVRFALRRAFGHGSNVTRVQYNREAWGSAPVLSWSPGSVWGYTAINARLCTDNMKLVCKERAYRCINRILANKRHRSNNGLSSFRC